jgi:uncharacterized protein (DUF2147 family)
LAAAPVEAEDVFGVWRADDGNMDIRLSACAEGLCAEVVRISEAAPEAARRNAEGFRVEKTFRWNGRAWTGGRVYLPSRGRAYSAKFEPLEAGRLQVQGCAHVVLCEEHVWTRVD